MRRRQIVRRVRARILLAVSHALAVIVADVHLDRLALKRGRRSVNGCYLPHLHKYSPDMPVQAAQQPG